MLETNTLAGRIDAEFAPLAEKYEKSRTEQVRQQQEREQRLVRLRKSFDQLSDVWKPRMEMLARKFGDKVQVTPRLTPSTCEATFEFKSSLAHVTLRFSAATDREVTKITLRYDLRIIPILTEFEHHSELAFPLDALDIATAAQWIDDRIITFVKTYLSLHENGYYLQDEMVEDPVAKVRFPMFAAGSTLEFQGRTDYFIGA